MYDRARAAYEAGGHTDIANYANLLMNIGVALGEQGKTSEQPKICLHPVPSVKSVKKSDDDENLAGAAPPMINAVTGQRCTRTVVLQFSMQKRSSLMTTSENRRALPMPS